MSKLIIEEPPLQVLPSLAVEIGLNEAIVLQQLHYLLRDPRFGKRIAEEQWIFNTFEQWQSSYFPFWSVRTIKTIFTNLAKLKVIVTCQPEGRISRRKYYRIDRARLASFPDRAKSVPSIVQKSSVPITKTTSSKTTLSKEPKETPLVPQGADVSSDSEKEHSAVWKPIQGTKKKQLARIKPPDDYPSEAEFDDFLDEEGLDQLAMGKRSDLYASLCDDKWHQWTGRRWRKINDWQAYVRALDNKIAEACGE